MDDGLVDDGLKWRPIGNFEDLQCQSDVAQCLKLLNFFVIRFKVQAKVARLSGDSTYNMNC